MFYNSRIQGEGLASKINLSPPVATFAVRSNVVALLQFICMCLLLRPLFVGFNVRSLFCFAVLHVVSYFAIISLGKRELVALFLL